MVFLSFPVLVLFYSESNLLWSPAGRQCRSGGVDRLVQENLDQVIGAVIFFIARFVAVAVVFFRIFRYDNRVLAPDIPDAFIQAAVQGDAGVDLHPPGLHIGIVLIVHTVEVIFIFAEEQTVGKGDMGGGSSA